VTVLIHDLSVEMCIRQRKEKWTHVKRQKTTRSTVTGVTEVLKLKRNIMSIQRSTRRSAGVTLLSHCVSVRMILNVVQLSFLVLIFCSPKAIHLLPEEHGEILGRLKILQRRRY